VANVIGDAAAIAFLLGNSLHIVGDLGGASVELEAALQYWPHPQRTGIVHLGFDHDILARINLAKTLCLQGYLSQAAERAREAVREAQDIDHPIALSIVLRQAVLLFLWIGDLPSAEQLIDCYAANAQSHVILAPQIAVGHALKGELAIRRGDAQRGVEILRDCVEELHAVRYKMMEFNISLAEGLSATGRFAESMSLIDDGIRQVEANGDAIYMPELLRVRGNLLLAKPQACVEQAEMYFSQSLELSRQQGARVWDLRTATDLAKLMAAQGRRDDARTLLGVHMVRRGPGHGRSEGGGTPADDVAVERVWLRYYPSETSSEGDLGRLLISR
jgi:tetratricopeptide (TPR) repeat protein